MFVSINRFTIDPKYWEVFEGIATERRAVESELGCP